MRALVYKSTGSWYKVKTDDGEWKNARIAGKLRLEGYKSTNPVAVGDAVEVEEEGENLTIIGVHERKNCIVRKSNKLSKQTQVLASNIDELLILASLKDPKTSLGFIDRLTVASKAYEIKASICFNKMDLWDAEDMEYFNEIRDIYQFCGFDVISCSATEETNIQSVEELIKDKTILVAGHSGVGKSSLLNAIHPELNLQVGETSEVHQKGKHTTTFAEMHQINATTYVIDTPGIREFGLIQIDEAELPNYFPEMFDLLPDCKFYNCKHINEPQCAVLKALEEGELPGTRYHSYISMVENEDIYQ